MDVGEALSQHVEDTLERISEKYFNHTTHATVVFTPEASHLIKAFISMHIGKGIDVNVEATAADAYAAFDNAAEKVAKRLRRHKNRLKDHHANNDQVPSMEMMANDYVLAMNVSDDAEESKEAGNENHSDQPLIIAEMKMPIESLTVSQAAMRMDLSGQSALMFRNAKHDGLNMVYRRKDGNVGWIDPAEEAEAKSA